MSDFAARVDLESVLEILPSAVRSAERSVGRAAIGKDFGVITKQR